MRSPLWEVADDCRGAGLIAPGTVGVDVLGAAVIDLARKGDIRIRVGLWDDAEPKDVDVEQAEPLLLDRRRYSSSMDIAEGLDRVCYVNVDNIVE
jgi:hypothetical protein